MSESEKKGSAWPWIAVPLSAIVLFFVLRECQHRLPPAEHAPTGAPAPETPASDPKPAEDDSATTPAAAPAPQ